MEGSTIFAGFEKPFFSRMTCIKRMSCQSFISIAKLYGREADCA